MSEDLEGMQLHPGIRQYQQPEQKPLLNLGLVHFGLRRARKVLSGASRRKARKKMDVNRRNFLKVAGASLVAGLSNKARVSESTPVHEEGPVACLVDTTRCIGCRKCEEACNRSNQLPPPDRPFEDQWVLRSRRRPDATHYTVINSYPGSPSQLQTDRKETNIKVQCMHCLDPACVSACIVGALVKSPEGPVIYDSHKCIGCRYCLVACPFEIPAYEYHNPLDPKVQKCTYCVDEKEKTGAAPACAAACPMEAIVFGKRSEMLDLGHRRIKEKPARYEDNIYGEKEVGGTSWLYLTGRPAEELDLPKLPETAPARLSEAIQHGIFNYGAIPLLFYGSLVVLMWVNHRQKRDPIATVENQNSLTQEDKNDRE